MPWRDGAYSPDLPRKNPTAGHSTPGDGHLAVFCVVTGLHSTGSQGYRISCMYVFAACVVGYSWGGNKKTARRQCFWNMSFVGVVSL